MIVIMGPLDTLKQDFSIQNGIKRCLSALLEHLFKFETTGAQPCLKTLMVGQIEQNRAELACDF